MENQLFQYSPTLMGNTGSNHNDSFNQYTVRIRTQLGIYGQMQHFDFGSSLKLCRRKLPQSKVYILPYIHNLVPLRIQYTIPNNGTLTIKSINSICDTRHVTGGEHCVKI